MTKSTKSKLQVLRPTIKILEPRIKSNGASWRSGRTTTSRGYGYRWQQVREQYLRQHPLCATCEGNGLFISASVVDHKIPHRGQGALFWDETNWQSLCKRCHDAKTRGGA